MMIRFNSVNDTAPVSPSTVASEPTPAKACKCGANIDDAPDGWTLCLACAKYADLNARWVRAERKWETARAAFERDIANAALRERALRDELAALTAEREAGRKDAKRLDWLDAKAEGVFVEEDVGSRLVGYRW